LSGNVAAPAVDFTVTAGSSAVTLTDFLFDAFREDASTCEGYTLEILSGGGLTAQTVSSGNFAIQGWLGIPAPGSVNYEDFNISLAGLTGGSELAAGQSVTFRLTYAPPSSWGQGFLDNMAVVGMVQSGTSPFEAWMFGYELDPSSALIDSDGDGQNNLTEFALGGNPTNGTDMGRAISMLNLDGSGADYIYPRYKDYVARNLNYQVEAASNLLSGVWSTNGVTITGVTSLDADFEAVTNRILSVDDQLFMRLKIELTE